MQRPWLNLKPCSPQRSKNIQLCSDSVTKSILQADRFPVIPGLGVRGNPDCQLGDRPDCCSVIVTSLRRALTILRFRVSSLLLPGAVSRTLQPFSEEVISERNAHKDTTRRVARGHKRRDLQVDGLTVPVPRSLTGCILGPWRNLRFRHSYSAVSVLTSISLIGFAVLSLKRVGEATCLKA